jgi:hypothetical protein
MATGDLDGDRVLDLAVANVYDHTVAVLRGLGDGRFALPSFCATGIRPSSVAIGDLNRDGLPDLAVGNYLTDDVAVLLGIGNGTFGPAAFYGAGDGPSSVAIGDLNGDEVLDIVSCHRRSDDVAVLLGTGLGPVAVMLPWFEVVTTHATVTIAWKTVIEANHFGFHIYRAESGLDRFVRINDEMIRSAGSGGRRYEFIDRGVVAGETYEYRLEAVDTGGATQSFELGSVTVSEAAPIRLFLQQNRPNPFAESTEIAFSIAAPAPVTLGVYDVSGRLVRLLLARDVLGLGQHRVAWDARGEDGRRVSPGIYFYRLRAGEGTVERRLQVLR